jgi:hypothetical protein
MSILTAQEHLSELKKYLILVEAEASFTARRYVDNGTTGRIAINDDFRKRIERVKATIAGLEEGLKS